MEHHLDHEEDDALPLIQSVSTPADWAGPPVRCGDAKASRALPSTFRGSSMVSRAEQQQFLAARPLRAVIARLVWEPCANCKRRRCRTKYRLSSLVSDLAQSVAGRSGQANLCRRTS